MQARFQKAYALTYSHIDWRGIACPAAYFDFMQDAATIHARQAHLDRDDLSLIWVLSRMYVTFDRALGPYDTLSLSTWCAGIKGPCWMRAFSFTSNGQPVGRAISAWVTLHPVTRRIVRPSAVPAASEYLRAAYDTLPLPGKLALSGLTLHHTHPIMYSDLDINNHLNNVKIAALVSDALDLGTDDLIRTLQINYTAETPAGLTLSLYAVRHADGQFGVRGEADGRVRFEAAGLLETR